MRVGTGRVGMGVGVGHVHCKTARVCGRRHCVPSCTSPPMQSTTGSTVTLAHARLGVGAAASLESCLRVRAACDDGLRLGGNTEGVRAALQVREYGKGLVPCVEPFPCPFNAFPRKGRPCASVVAPPASCTSSHGMSYRDICRDISSHGMSYRRPRSFCSCRSPPTCTASRSHRRGCWRIPSACVPSCCPERRRGRSGARRVSATITAKSAPMA